MGVAMRVTAVLVAVCGIGAAPVHAAFPGENGRIAFTRQDRAVWNSQHPFDVFTALPSGLGTMRLTTSGAAEHPAWSPDGTRIAFVDSGDLVTAAEDGTQRETVLTSPGSITDVGWSPAGDKLAVSLATCSGCTPDVYTVSTDGSGLTNLTSTPGLGELGVSWSPDGSLIAFGRGDAGEFDLFTIRPDGTDETNITTAVPFFAQLPDWSPDGARIAFVGPGDPDDLGHSTAAIYSMPAGGGSATRLGALSGAFPAWSPDGSRIAFTSPWTSASAPQRTIWTFDAADGGNARPAATPATRYWDVDPDWQPVPQPPPAQQPLVGPGYPRPKGATPLRASLVLAYDQCSAPNRTHGPPLAFPSCHPPARSSQPLTVGTPDANGHLVLLKGFVSFQVVAGAPGRPEDAAVRLSASVNDVYWSSGCTGSPPPCDLEPYLGELEGVVSLRMTDRFNDGGIDGTEAATTGDASFSFPIQCAYVGPDPLCRLETDVNAIVPGLVRERRRAVWELGDVRILDAGPDGLLSTAGDQSTFLRQGIFIP